MAGGHATNLSMAFTPSGGGRWIFTAAGEPLMSRKTTRPRSGASTANAKTGATFQLDYTSLEARQLLAGNILSSSPDGQWLGIDPAVLTERSGEQLVHFRNFGLYDLQESVMVGRLGQAPLEFTNGYLSQAVTISIPRPDQSYARFSIVEAPIMEPGLAAQFPDIKTYRGTGIDDPAATIRFDVTMHGFHAQVLTPHGHYYVDPFFRGQTEFYASYFVSDTLPHLEHDDHAEDHSDCLGCATESGEFMAPLTGAGIGSGNTLQSPEFAPPFGTQLRTFRLANAATGEYTAFWGGTVAQGQAAIVTAINRVTGVYEKDLAIRMVLVANNSSLVYTNGATDPYTNNNGSTMLGQNQTNVTNVIGSANYDIGHVFSTGGGGVAGLGVVGNSANKARGVTGSPSPTGDPFYIDYVAHEMGHQFGGNHSFNGSGGSCSGNRAGSAAYEPGSGSTIMSYAGICSGDDLQPNSDAMFHSVSIDEIRALITTGGASGTGTTTNTGNNVPTISAGSDYVIPTGTPFELTAAGSDADPTNVLTYSWEQRSLGAAQTLAAADNGASPLFRTWNPTTSSTRVFPRLSNLLANTLPVGEKLPAVARASMVFRVVVRDNASGGGGVNSDDMSIQVVNTGAAFSVTSFNAGGTWTGLSSQAITWNVAGTTGSGINAANVDIWLMLDGGLSYTLLAAGTPNDGSHTITVPNISTTTARIKVKAAGNVFFDINNANITVTPTVTPTVNLSGPAGQIPEGHTGSSQANFVLTLSQAPASTVTVNYATTSSGFGNPATAGSDYTAVSGVATFLAGQTTFNVPVTVFGDRFTEGIEQFGMTLSSPSGLIIGTGSVTASISDDDAFALGKPIDLGTASSPVEVGATGFSTGDYSSFVGIGWTASSDMLSFQLTQGSDTTRDMVLCTTGNFRIDLPNGNYSVQTVFGIVDFTGARENYPMTFNNFTVFVEGTAYPLVLETGANISRTFVATVADGKLDLGLDSGFVRRSARFAGIVVTALGGRSGGGGGGGDGGGDGGDGGDGGGPRFLFGPGSNPGGGDDSGSRLAGLMLENGNRRFGSDRSGRNDRWSGDSGVAAGNDRGGTAAFRKLQPVVGLDTALPNPLAASERRVTGNDRTPVPVPLRGLTESVRSTKTIAAIATELAVDEAFSAY